MICPRCGKRIDEGNSFCPYCGGRIAVSAQQETTGKKPERERSDRLGLGKWSRIALIVGGLLLLALGIVWYFYGTHDAGRKTRSWKEIQKSLAASLSVLDEYQKDDGSIRSEKAKEAIQAVFDAVKDTKGVVSCQKDEYGVFIETASGLDFVYAPRTEEPPAGEESLGTVTLPFRDSGPTGTASQPNTGGPDEGKAGPSTADEIWEPSLDGADIDDSDVTMDRLLNLDGCTLILWQGCGGYSTSTGFYICTEIKVTEQLLERYPEINEDTAVCGLDGTLYLKPEFFRDNFADDAFKGAIIYLGFAGSGDEMALADVLVDKGAAVVFVNSGSLSYSDGVALMQQFMEAFCSGDARTLEEALSMAKQACGYSDEDGLDYVGPRDVDGLTYEMWMELLRTEPDEETDGTEEPGGSESGEPGPDEDTAAPEIRRLKQVTITSEDGQTVTTYEYDENGRIVQAFDVWDPAIEELLNFEYSYNEDGTLASESYRDASGMRDAYGYAYGYGSDDVYGYEYDDSGRIVGQTIESWDAYSSCTFEYEGDWLYSHGYGGQAGLEENGSYAFDEMGRLVYWDSTSTASGIDYGAEFTFEYTGDSPYPIVYEDYWSSEGSGRTDWVLSVYDSFINKVTGVSIPADAVLTHDEQGYLIAAENDSTYIEIEYESVGGAQSVVSNADLLNSCWIFAGGTKWNNLFPMCFFADGTFHMIQATGENQRTGVYSYSNGILNLDGDPYESDGNGGFISCSDYTTMGYEDGGFYRTITPDAERTYWELRDSVVSHTLADYLDMTTRDVVALYGYDYELSDLTGSMLFTYGDGLWFSYNSIDASRPEDGDFPIEIVDVVCGYEGAASEVLPGIPLNLTINEIEAVVGPVERMYNPESEWLSNVWYAVARYKGYSITLQWFNGPYEGVPDEVTIVKGDDYVLR